MNVPYVKKVLKEENLKWHIEIIHKEATHKGRKTHVCHICNKKFTIYDIRQFDKKIKPRENDDKISKLIDSFFILNEHGKVWTCKSS